MNLSQVKEELEKGYRFFKVFENARDVIGALEGAEQREKELNKIVSTLSDKGMKLNRANEDAAEELKGVKAKIATIMEAAIEKAKKAGASMLEDSEHALQENNEHLLSLKELIEEEKQKLEDLVKKTEDLEKNLSVLEKKKSDALEKLTAAFK